MEQIIFYIVLCGGTFAWVLGLGQLVIKKRKQLNYLLCALCLSVGTLLFHFCRELTVGTYETSSLTDIYEPSIHFVIAPLLYLSFSQMIDSGYLVKRRHLIHFLPAVSSLIVLFIMQRLSVVIDNEAVVAGYDAVNRFCYILSSWSMMSYALYSFRKSYSLIKAGKSRYPEAKLVTLALQSELILIALLLVLATILLSFTLFKILCLLVVQLLLTIFFLMQRYPGYLLNIQKVYSKARYEHSKVIGIDVPSVVRRLEDLMEIEKIYENDELSLSQVSELLNITTQQLSQILNETLGCSFPRYVARYRLEAAKELLQKDRNQSILSIAFSVGFKSKSSFNASFKNEYNMTPSEYRIQTITR